MIGAGAVSAWRWSAPPERAPVASKPVPTSFLQPQRPPLTAAEEAYAASLWPIHSDVKLSAVNMTFAGLSYKLGEIDLPTLQAKIAPLAANLTDATARLHKLQPPPSRREAQQSYARALELYQAAHAEMGNVVADGRDEHLIAAHQQSQQAAMILIKLSDELWPGEYKPH